MISNAFNLGGLSWATLQTPHGLRQLDAWFLKRLAQDEPILHEMLIAYRAKDQCYDGPQLSDFLIHLADYTGDLLAQELGIFQVLQSYRHQHLNNQDGIDFAKYVSAKVNKRYVTLTQDQRTALCAAWPTHLQWLCDKCQVTITETNVASKAMALWQKYRRLDACDDTILLPLIEALVSARLAWPQIAHDPLFDHPVKTDPDRLLDMHSKKQQGYGQHTAVRQVNRQGFDLIDQGKTTLQVARQMDYCVFCHDKSGDFCRRGFPVKKGDIDRGYRYNAIGNHLLGCPLDQRISEMQVLASKGQVIGALLMILRDNPMVAATGHRICNDCQKACIYQKQTPVDVPAIESKILTDVLHMPYGVELLGLMMQFNPLRDAQYVPELPGPYRVAIMGMGPAGMAMAHYLVMQGVSVCGFDGLKIEPLPTAWLSEPIMDYTVLNEALSKRTVWGFGGVAEYGITARWNKNHLTLLYILLARRQHFTVIGNQRFGGTLTIDRCWSLGFDHLVLAVGAGLPKALPIVNSMAPGMRQANDFLMALQLCGAVRKDTLALLDIAMPVVVIGAGLTAVDAATEAQAYYITLLDRIASRWRCVETRMGRSVALALFSQQQRDQFEIVMHHIDLLAQYREKSGSDHDLDMQGFCHSLGSVSIVYRRDIKDSPAYRLNHTELQAALDQGIIFRDWLDPRQVQLDDQGHVDGLVVQPGALDEQGQWKDHGSTMTLPCRSILVATGAKPNVAYSFEHPKQLDKSQGSYITCHVDGLSQEVLPPSEALHVKSPSVGFFSTYQKDGKRVSIIGDAHRVFHGSVVKAIASAKRAYKPIMAHLETRVPNKLSSSSYAQIVDDFSSTIVHRQRVSEHVWILTIKSAFAVRVHQAGHMYRLQTYERHARRQGDILLHSEAVTLSPLRCDVHKGCFEFVVDTRQLGQYLLVAYPLNCPIALMGPSGVRYRINKGQQVESVMVIADMADQAKAWHITKALHDHGNTVAVLLLDTDEQLPVMRQQWDQLDVPMAKLSAEDMAKQDEDFIDGLLQSLSKSNEINADRMLWLARMPYISKLQKTRNHKALPHWWQTARVSASVHGPIQCMLKGVCAQCLQWQIDPQTGQRTKAVFACSWQDQPLELIDLEHLSQRQQNHWLSPLYQAYIQATLPKA